MTNRKASFDAYNATCDSTIDGDDHNRAILMSFSDTLSSTKHNFTRDSLSTTLNRSCSSNVDSTIAEQTISLSVKQCTPKIIGDEILIEPYSIPRKETFVSRIPKFNHAKSNEPVRLNDDKKSSVVHMTKNLYDVENIRQSNLWPALTALETSLHSSDEEISLDDTDILKKLDEEFSYSPRRFTATLMTIVEESFSEWGEGNGDVSRFGLMELLKTTVSSGKRLEDESPPKCMFSCSGRNKQTDDEAGPDCDNKSYDRFISFPSESQAFADESPQSSYLSIEPLTITTGTGRLSTKEPKKYVNTARLTVNPDTPANSTNRVANWGRNRTPVKRMPRSPVSRPKINSVSFEGIADESPQTSYLSVDALTITTGAERISTREPKKYVKTPRITVDSGTPIKFTNLAANFWRNRTPVKRMPRSPISRPKINSITFEGIADESPQSYSSFETSTVSTSTGKISTKEPKKYIKTPRIIVDPGTPIISTNWATNCRRNRTPVKRIPRSPVGRPKINALSFEGIIDHRSGSSILSPLSNKDDDEYLTAESEIEEVSDVSENTQTDGSPKKKLDMSNIASHHRKWVRTFEQHSRYTCNTSLRTTERKRKLSNHTNKLEKRWLKELAKKRQKCFDLVDEMLQKSVPDPSEPEVQSPCSCPTCKLSKEFCRTLSAFEEYIQYAMHAPEITETKKNTNHRFVTSVKMNLKTKNSKSPCGARKSMSKLRRSLNKAPRVRFLSSRTKLTPSPQNRGVLPKKGKETRVDTSSIRTVSQLRKIFSPRPETAGCSEFKTLDAKQTIPRKTPLRVGSERKDNVIFLPGHGPSYYKKVVSPVGEYIRGKKAA